MLERLAAARRSAIAPFHVMDVLAAAKQRQRTHGDLVSLGAGQPSSPAPAPVLRTATAPLRGDALGYTEQLGLPELRTAIAEHYLRTYGLPVTADDVVATTG